MASRKRFVSTTTKKELKRKPPNKKDTKIVSHFTHKHIRARRKKCFNINLWKSLFVFSKSNIWFVSVEWWSLVYQKWTEPTLIYRIESKSSIWLFFLFISFIFLLFFFPQFSFVLFLFVYELAKTMNICSIYMLWIDNLLIGKLRKISKTSNFLWFSIKTIYELVLEITIKTIKDEQSKKRDTQWKRKRNLPTIKHCRKCVFFCNLYIICSR